MSREAKNVIFQKRKRKGKTVPMETFCTEREWLEIVNRERRWTVIFRILAVLTPAVFTVLCLLTRTGNARVMHGAMLAATAILGGAAIAVYTLQLRPARQERKHLEMLRKEQKTLMEGRLEVTVESFRIPKSVRVRRVILASGKEDERPALLNVDERWVDRLPPDGSLVRIAAVHSYIAGAETLEEKPGPKAEGRKVSRARAFFRGVAAVGPLLVLWAFFTVIFGSFVFYQITDTVPARKITLFIDGVTAGEDQLAARLEERLGDPIRMVKIHPFSYMMFGDEELKTADLYILPDSHREQYGEWLAPGDEGILMYDPESGAAVAGDTFLYTAGEEAGEVFRLYTGAKSPHLEDGMARQAAEKLIAIGMEKEETR